jgi:hypothetical protein
MTLLQNDVNVLRAMLENPDLNNLRTLRELHNWVAGFEVDLNKEIDEKMKNSELAS